MFGRKARLIAELRQTFVDIRRVIAEQEETIEDARNARRATRTALAQVQSERDTLNHQLERALRLIGMRYAIPATVMTGGYTMSPEPSPAQQERVELRASGYKNPCPACPHDKVQHDGQGCVSCNCRVPYHRLVAVNVKP